MSKVGLLADKLFDQKKVPLEVEDCWAAPWYFLSQRELPSWHKLHIQNFTHRALECNWHTISSILRHPTSQGAVTFISLVWHSDTDFTFRTWAQLTQTSLTSHYTSSQLHKESAVALRSPLWQKLHIILPNKSTHNGLFLFFKQVFHISSHW